MDLSQKFEVSHMEENADGTELTTDKKRINIFQINTYRKGILRIQH